MTILPLIWIIAIAQPTPWPVTAERPPLLVPPEVEIWIEIDLGKSDDRDDRNQCNEGTEE